MLRHSIFLISLAGASLIANAAPKPNIVYFYADDLGWGTIKANKPDSKLLTPNIDALASGGINFARGYGCMVCSPARSSQQTGFHQGHTWTDRNDPDKTKAIRAEDQTIGDVLKTAGYHTAYYGKWGYGADSDKVDPAINNPQTLPINHGYDELLAELHHVRAHTFFQPTLWAHVDNGGTLETTLIPNAVAKGDPNYPDYPAYQNEATYPSPAYCDDSYAFAAMDFIRRHANSSSPFFVNLAFQIPHTPLGEIDNLPKWFDAYAGVTDSDGWEAANKQFAAMVTRMDAHIGNIIDVLKDPNNDGSEADSVLNNTLIIFASDNGGQSGTPKTFFSTNGPLSGSKGSVSEGGIRVPTVMYWAGTIAGGQNITTPVDVTDILPTLADLAGVPAPVGTDGVSLAPTLTGQGVQRRREFLSHESGSNWSIIRGDIKLRNNGKMYNLALDPSESNNIASANSALVTEMQAIAAAEFVGHPDDTFANSFRTWEGADGSVFEADASWSDPAYPASHPTLANDYSPNTPNAQWNAVMRNTTSLHSSTSLAVDAELLAIEVGGNTTALKTQTLVVPDGITLTGRNEIRISDHGVIDLDGGTLDTVRWVDIFESGALGRGGDVTGHVYNSGKITVSATTLGNPGSPGTPGGTTAQEILANGGFEEVSGNGSYPTVASWGTEDGFPTTKTLAKTNDVRTGTYRAQIHGEPSAPNGAAIQQTDHHIVLNDQFRLSFWHRPFSAWDSNDKIRVELFYVNDSSERVNLFTTTVTPVSGVWTEANVLPSAISDNNAVGRKLWILFTPDQASESNGTEWAGLDDISLTVDAVTPPTPPTPATDERRLRIAKDFRQQESGSLNIELESTGVAGEDYGQLDVSETAYLSGSLNLIHAAGFTPESGDSFTIVSANLISGRFQHADDMISVDGHHYKITYATESVTVSKVDTTGNGTPHAWLGGYGLGTDDSLDDDGDGIATWKEFIAGTDPTDASSGLKLGIDHESQPVALEWPAEDDRLYYIESSNDLDNFITIAGPFEKEPVMNRYELPASAETSIFYRIRVERK